MHITPLEQELDDLIDHPDISKEHIWEVIRNLVVSLRRGTFAMEQHDDLLYDQEETLRFVNRYALQLKEDDEFLVIRTQNAFVYVNRLIGQLEQEQKKLPSGTQSHDRDRMVIFFKVSSNAYKHEDQFILELSTYHDAIRSIVEKGIYPEPNKRDDEILQKGGRESVYRPLRLNLLAETESSDDFTIKLAIALLNLNISRFKAYLLKGVTTFELSESQTINNDEDVSEDQLATKNTKQVESDTNETIIRSKEPSVTGSKRLVIIFLVTLLLTSSIVFFFWYSSTNQHPDIRESIALNDLFTRSYDLDNSIPLKEELIIAVDSFYISDQGSWIRLRFTNLSTNVAFYPDAIIIQPTQKSANRNPIKTKTITIIPTKTDLTLALHCEQQQALEWIIESPKGRALFTPRKQALGWIKVMGRNECDRISRSFKLGFRYHSSENISTSKIKMIDQVFEVHFR